MSHELFEFRSYIQEDIAFIQSSWAQSYYQGGQGHKQLDADEFHHFHRPLREKILQKPNATAIVCSATKDPDTILGWIVVEKPIKGPYLICHYIYVKATFKGEGIARQLINMALPIRPVLYTHSTHKARKIIKENWQANKNDFERWFYTPHII